MLAGSAVIFLAVFAILALALYRPARLRVLGARNLILWGGIWLPGAILATLLLAAMALGENLLASPREEPPMRIEVMARQWRWTFRYPDGSLGENRLILPVGREVDLAVASEDVIHSVWIPRLGGKIDAIPGHVNIIRLRADRQGVYGGICAEFCGTGHSAMHFLVEAREEADK